MAAVAPAIIKAFLLAGMKKERRVACSVSSRALLQEFHSVFMACQSVAEPEIEARFPGSYSKLFPTICLLPLAFSSDFF